MGHYPCDCVLDFLANEDIFKNGAKKVIDTLLNEWEYPEYVRFELLKPEEQEKYSISNEPTYLLEISTGGWSGNEDLISALDRNKYFNMLFWYSHQRGGHYVYIIPAKYYDDNFKIGDGKDGKTK